MTRSELKQIIQNQFMRNGKLIHGKTAIFRDELIGADIVEHTPNCTSSNMIERIYWILADLDEYPCKCPTCGKRTKSFWNIRKGYLPRACSTSCALKNPEVKEKARQRSLEKYGVEHPSKLESVNEKRKKTNIEKYGVDNPLKSDKVKEGMKARCLEKHGVDHVTKLQATQDSKKKTLLEKYGVVNVSQVPEFQEKKRLTQLERYGRHSAGDPVIAGKRGRSKMLKALDKKITMVECEYEPLFTHDEYGGSKFFFMWRHLECEFEFEGTLRNGSLPVCPKCFPPLSGTSSGEQEVFSFVSNIYHDAVNGDRGTLYPRELDVLVPSKNIAFEYDGLYWHSFDRAETGEERKYHLQKTEDAAAKGVRLVHIFENEWKNKREIVESRIANLLGRSKKIGARKCQVVELDARTAIDFMEKSHIQGSCPSTVKLGLKYGDEIVAVMTFGRPRYNKDVEYELLRYSNALGCSVVGGASKLFKHFVKVYAPKSVISYSDRRWNTGKLYENIGFKFIENTPPSYYYVIPGTCDLRHRSAFMKSKLPGILGERFDPAKTESQNMFDAGYRRIWDCGTSKWLFTSS